MAGYKTSTYLPWTSLIGLRGGWESSTATGAVTLTKPDSQFQRIDPGGAHRDVTLPTVEKDMDGYFMVVANAANAAENLVIKDADGNTIATANQNDCAVVYVDSAGDWQLFWMFTGTIS